MENIQKNRNILLKEIKNCHQKSAFKKFDVTKLVAVSKKQEDYKIELAIAGGQKIFGENRVQEAQTRWEERQKIYKDLDQSVLKIFDVKNSMNSKNSYGGTSSNNIRKMIKK